MSTSWSARGESLGEAEPFRYQRSAAESQTRRICATSLARRETNGAAAYQLCGEQARFWGMPGVTEQAHEQFDGGVAMRPRG